MEKFSIGGIRIPQDKGLFFIAGPCLIEGRDMAMEVAAELSGFARQTGVPVLFKGSFRKANRSSKESFTGIGDTAALENPC